MDTFNRIFVFMLCVKRDILFMFCVFNVVYLDPAKVLYQPVDFGLYFRFESENLLQYHTNIPFNTTHTKVQ